MSDHTVEGWELKRVRVEMGLGMISVEQMAREIGADPEWLARVEETEERVPVAFFDRALAYIGRLADEDEQRWLRRSEN